MATPCKDSSSANAIGGGTPKIAFALTPSMRRHFAESACRPEFVELIPGRPVWLPPGEAQALFTFASAWSAAPADRPSGWPFSLRWIQLASAGVDGLPSWAWEGVTVTCARGVTAEPIAEFVIAAIFGDAKRTENIRAKDRESAIYGADERNWPPDTMTSVRGKSLGVVGYGAIGRTIATKALALGMNVKAVRRTTARSEDDKVEFVANILDLVADVDHLVLCAPSTPHTRRMIDASVFAAMKRGMHLINVARGDLVDHPALADAIENGQVRRASLDVTDPEPLPEGHPFYRDSRVFITPHAAWYSPDHFERLTTKLVANLERFARNEPLQDVVDAATGY
jgi:phosphoglycerate dehydrogenase-like enzyme